MINQNFKKIKKFLKLTPLQIWSIIENKKCYFCDGEIYTINFGLGWITKCKKCNFIYDED